MGERDKFSLMFGECFEGLNNGHYTDTQSSSEGFSSILTTLLYRSVFGYISFLALFSIKKVIKVGRGEPISGSFGVFLQMEL